MRMPCKVIAASSGQRRYGCWQSGNKPSLIGSRNCTPAALDRCSVTGLPVIETCCRQDGSGLDIAKAWMVDVAVHYIRKVSYRGSRFVETD